MTSGHDLGQIEIPALLRRQGTGVDAAEAAMIAFSPTNPNLEDLVVHIVGHLEGGGLIEELPDLVRRLMPEEATCQPVQVVQAVQAVQVAMALIGDEGTCWMLLALWVVQRPAVEGLGNFEAPLLASVSRTSVTPDDIGRVWTVFEQELGQVVASVFAAPASGPLLPSGSSHDSAASAGSRRQQRLSAALSGSGG